MAWYYNRVGDFVDADDFPTKCELCGRKLRAHRVYGRSHDAYNAIPYEEIKWQCDNHGTRYYTRLQPGKKLKGVNA